MIAVPIVLLVIFVGGCFLGFLRLVSEDMQEAILLLKVVSCAALAVAAFIGACVGLVAWIEAWL